MLNQIVPAAVTGLPYSARPPHLRLGARVVVELTGAITSYDRWIGHYSIQPHDPRASSIHVQPAYIFPEDDSEPVAEEPVHLRLGARVVVEIVGTVLERIPQTDHYAIQPDDPRSSSIPIRPEYIFPEDSEPVLPPGLPDDTATIHAALSPLESPLSHADWNLTVLDLAFGHTRYDANGDVNQEWTAIGAQVGDALDFVREARKQFGLAWEAARGNSKPPQAPESPPTEPDIEVTRAGRAYLLLRSIVGRLNIEGDVASFTLTPEMADELAAFGTESEDLEQDVRAEATL